MYSYPNNYAYHQSMYNDRQFFFPFLVGAVAGGAAVGLTRPRPIYANNQPYNNMPNSGYGYYSNYGYYNPGYYYRPY